MVKKEFIFIGFLIIFLTSILSYQHSTGLSWDFVVYSLNAKWFTGEKIYFEWGRPPLAPFLLAVFNIFGSSLAEYILIFISLCAYIIGLFLLAKKFKKDPYIFTSFAVFLPIIFNLSMYAGVDLLSLALLLLSLARFPKLDAGVWYGMCVLSRYNMIIFLPLFLFLDEKPLKHLQKLFIFCFIILLTFSPWLFYNFLEKGDPFFSIKDSYTLNVLRRLDIRQPFNPIDIFICASFLSLLAPFGLIKAVVRREIFWMTFFLLALIAYILIPFKDIRYLIPIVPSVAYFSTAGINENKNKYIICGVIVFINFLLYLHSPIWLADPTHLYKAALLVSESNCSVSSNAWVYLNYYGVVTKPIPRENLMEEYLDKGYQFVVFWSIRDPEFITSSKYHKHLIFNNSVFGILHKKNNCSEREESFALIYSQW